METSSFLEDASLRNVTPYADDVIKVTHDAMAFVEICEAFIIPIILALGIVTNITCLGVLPRTTIVNNFKICLIALSLSDLVACMLQLANSVLEEVVFQGDLPFGTWDDVAIVNFTLYYLYSIFICWSSTIVIAIVAIRHKLISDPINARHLLTPTKVKVICFLLFLGTLMLFVPTFANVVWQSCFADGETQFCVEVVGRARLRNMEKLRFYLAALTVLFGPVLVVCYITSFVGIRVSLGKSGDLLRELTTRGSPSKSGDKTSRRRKLRMARITRTLLLVLVCDAVCTLPLCAQAFALVIAPYKTVFSLTNIPYKVFDAIVEIFLALKIVYNFWLYAVRDTKFRKVLVEDYRKFVHYTCNKPPEFSVKKKKCSQKDPEKKATLEPNGNHQNIVSHEDKGTEKNYSENNKANVYMASHESVRHLAQELTSSETSLNAETREISADLIDIAKENQNEIPADHVNESSEYTPSNQEAKVTSLDRVNARSCESWLVGVTNEAFDAENGEARSRKIENLNCHNNEVEITRL